MVKVILFGPTNSGKTIAVLQMENKNMSTQPTIGAEIHTFNVDGIEYVLWDTSGDPKNRTLGDGYYLYADAGILFTTSKMKSKDLEPFIKDFKRVCPTAPIACVGQNTSREMNAFLRKHSINHFETLPIAMSTMHKYYCDQMKTAIS